MSTTPVQHLIGQLTPEEPQAYLKESVFVNSNLYDDDRLARLVRKASEAKEEQRPAARRLPYDDRVSDRPDRTRAINHCKTEFVGSRSRRHQ